MSKRWICIALIAALLGTFAVLPKFSTAEPAPAGANVEGEAKTLLDQVGEAYKSIDTLTTAGTISFQLKINGEDKSQSANFTSSLAGGKFRHEIKDDVVTGSTGEMVYAYRPKSNQYITDDGFKKRGDALPSAVAGILSQQNPSLLLALVADPSAELLEGTAKAQRQPDATIDGTACNVLRLTNNRDEPIDIFVDAKTHLIRRVVIDAGKSMQKQNPAVSQAMITLDYTRSVANEKVADESQFAWSIPEGARDAAAIATANASGPSALEGKAAPDFELNGMDDAPIKLSALKGKVVVLDFWATWCGPCVQSLPHLDAMYKETQDEGVIVYAVNLKEDKAKVQKFIDRTSLGLPVLFDTEGETAKKYLVQGIPQTVVIGKDGKVKKVFVGSDTHDQIKAAVMEAVKG